ncbi:hypothetical protein DBIPINDM_001590 [Mesorhizobium sp. AR02]|uniref:hypothetical protein n=1 Tax=Mesorhizobium sp. AR02 TaxID=2865837 RepID=UPI0021602FD6|nr:hypothetical protein [Mesorhizobium sp. AR02]UVK57274.1 hypothetical protein DBIPINDM_001590 [Mesorhizobium sp. AR02]
MIRMTRTEIIEALRAGLLATGFIAVEDLSTDEEIYLCAHTGEEETDDTDWSCARVMEGWDRCIGSVGHFGSFRETKRMMPSVFGRVETASFYKPSNSDETTNGQTK